jgi:hypothetical protein
MKSAIRIIREILPDEKTEYEAAVEKWQRAFFNDSLVVRDPRRESLLKGLTNRKEEGNEVSSMPGKYESDNRRTRAQQTTKKKMGL